MKLKKNSRPAPKSNGCPAWMMTFGDCMSLLVTFFVMLIAFSNIEEENLADMIGGMRGALGAVDRVGSNYLQEMAPETDGLTQVEGETGALHLLTIDELSDRIPILISEIQTRNHNQEDGWPDRILIQMLDEGLSIVVQTSTIFHQGTSEWADNSDSLWQGIANLLQNRNNRIRITSIISDQAPVHSSSVRTVWGLAIERANHVARRMQNEMEDVPARFGIGVQVIPENEPSLLPANSVEITILGKDGFFDLGEQQYWPENGKL